MKRITIILDEDTWDRLPIKGKSPFINLVLKNHFRKDNAEEFYKYIKQKLIQDGLVSDGSVTFDSIVTGVYKPPVQDEELENYRINYKDDGYQFRRYNGQIQVNKPPSRDWSGVEVLNY